MEAHLQSLKVPDLKSLLQGASLPVSGNKADLIKRLLEHPNATRDIAADTGSEQLAEAEPSNAEAIAESKIQAAQIPPSKAAIPEADVPKPSGPVTALTDATTKTTQSTSVTDDKTVASASETAQPSTSEQDEATRRALIEELEKRKARAVRFGQEQSEADRKLERAIKFGLDGSDEASMALLDKELASARKRGKDKNPAAAAAAAADKAQKVSGAKKELTEEEKAQREKERQELKERQQKEREVLEEQKRARAERFGLIDKEEEEKKRKRAEKFGNVTAANGSEPAEKKIKA